ncbi:hypothetical protein HIM_03750 [Hirsutella minnesotensis 3608]|uniref:Uncharacterized protein n=1 Tax=Hirsutella minnesotensis 3608 TaxID=1043627 RepID=A0A0F7ZVM5_9HYPO|nr:hypothetical protein HIM_03750 [Hirsutella minnesotensis 3608]
MTISSRASFIRLAVATAATLLLVPVAASAIQVVRLDKRVRAKTTASAGCRTSSHAAPRSLQQRQPRDPDSIPAHVLSARGSDWVVFFERIVSQPVPTSLLRPAAEPLEVPPTAADGAASEPSALLRRYMRATHVAFSWTPQAFLIRALIGDARLRRTFEASWIQNLGFVPGDVVNGVYRVARHEKQGSSLASSERIELLLDAPDSYTGPTARGLLVAAIEPATAIREGAANEPAEDPRVVFVNETWMWRRTDEKPVLLETPFGKWFHRVLSGWLILKGLSSVVASGAGSPQ